MTSPSQRIALGTGIHQLKWLEETRAGQEMLAASRQGDRRPRCMCAPGGIEMYIGRRGRLFYLSRMPGTGSLHADSCASGESTTLFSGIHAYAPGALVEQSDGVICLSSDIEQRARQTPPLTMVCIDGVLDALIEQADLNRICPNDPARTWSAVRGKLAEAAHWILLGGQSLSHVLYLPESYDKTRAVASLDACETFITTASKPVLLCAPLKDLSSSDYSWKVNLKHLPGLRLWVAKDVAAEIERRLGTPVFSQPPRYSLCLALTKPGRRAGNYTVTNLALIATDHNYFPCQPERVAQIAAELLASGHSLLRPLRFDCEPGHALADLALLDADDPVPVFVLSPSGIEALDLGKRRLANVMQRNKASLRIFEA